ncbi:MAG: tRNA synthetase class catalytic domain, partial [Acidimicrobiaceae bacterium]
MGLGAAAPWATRLRLFDTARGGIHPVEPRDPGKVSMYVCGPTVY